MHDLSQLSLYAGQEFVFEGLPGAELDERVTMTIKHMNEFGQVFVQSSKLPRESKWISIDVVKTLITSNLWKNPFDGL